MFSICNRSKILKIIFLREFDIRIIYIMGVELMIGFEEKVLQAYPQKIGKIAEYLSKNDAIRNMYNFPSMEEIISKLNEPSLRVFNNDSGVLTYCNHEFDNIHVIDLEFDGILERFFEVCIDG